MKNLTFVMQKALVIICLCALLASCTSRRTTIESRTDYRTDTVRASRTDTTRVASWREASVQDTAKTIERRLLTDSVTVRDTTRVTINADGSVNTDRTRYVSRYVGDTRELASLRTSVARYKDSLGIYRSRCDSLQRARHESRTVTVERPVEVNRLKWWQTALMWLGAAALVTVAASVGFHRKGSAMVWLTEEDLRRIKEFRARK